MRDAFIKRLCELAQNNPQIMLITGDLGFKVFDEFRAKFPRQFINAGVAEQNMIGLATGLALEGRIVFTYSIGNFVTFRCLEQIRNDACYHGANVKVVSMGGGFSYGALGISHHATEDIVYIVAEAGNHTIPLASGGNLEFKAGKITTNSIANTSFTTVPYPSATSFSATPVVFTGVSSYNESDPEANVVTTRVQNINASSFQVAMQEQESNSYSHVNEEIHYFAALPVTGTTASTLNHRAISLIFEKVTTPKYTVVSIPIVVINDLARLSSLSGVFAFISQCFLR